MYAPVATGRPKAVVPSGKERNWFTLIPISNRARASHYNNNKKIESVSHKQYSTHGIKMCIFKSKAKLIQQ